MNPLDRELAARLEALHADGLYRELRPSNPASGVRVTRAGRTLLNFSSNDYLGLSSHPALKEAAVRAIRDFGSGSGASRLISGSLAPHHELEEALAAFKGTAAALTFSTGYAAAVGALSALLGPSDVLIVDKRVHACIVDGARLCRARLRVFRHNDLDHVESHLRWAAAQGGHTLVVTESVFSMDGDHAPLRKLVELKDRHGAWLMVDEAHATGFHGPGRRGLADELGVRDRVEIQMGTLGKALGSAGGYIAGSRLLVDFLVNRARSFIFSTAPVPAQAAAAHAAVKLLQTDAGARLTEQLWTRVAQTREGLARLGWPVPADRSPIFPLVVGGEQRAVDFSERLSEAGFLVPAIRFPTVARGKARLRLTLSAAHAPEDVEQLLQAIGAPDAGVPAGGGA